MSDASMPHCPDCKQPQYACMCEPEDNSVADDKPEPSDPITLADVRARIECRIREYRLKAIGWRHISAEGIAEQLEAKIGELTEVLAMLDRAQPGGAG